jgi:hypothetical protein
MNISEKELQDILTDNVKAFIERETKRLVSLDKEAVRNLVLCIDEIDDHINYSQNLYNDFKEQGFSANMIDAEGALRALKTLKETLKDYGVYRFYESLKQVESR